MIQLSYDSAYDPYHTAFRILRICAHSQASSFKIPQIRILDFYLNFPHFLEKFILDEAYKLPRGGTGQIKKINFKDFPEPYSDLPDSRIIFRHMEIIQAAAMQTLCLRGFLDMEAYKQGTVQSSAAKIPDDLKQSLAKRNNEQKALMDFLVDFMGVIDLVGPKGLKARTHLLEHRYDTV